MAPSSIAVALALAATAPGGMRQPRKPLPVRFASFVAVRTADEVHAGRRLRYGDGHFRVATGEQATPVAETDVVHIVFVPALDGPPLATALDLAFRLSLPERGRRLAALRGELLDALRETGSIFFLPGDDLEKAFPRFARSVSDVELAAALCCELVHGCVKSHRERLAVQLLGDAEKLRVGSELGLAYGLMRLAVLKSMDDPQVPDEMRRLLERYRRYQLELRVFRGRLLGDRRWEPRRPPEGPREPRTHRPPAE